MMKRSALFAALSLMLAPSSTGLASSEGPDPSAPILHLEMTYGDLNSVFDLVRGTKDFQLNFSNSEGKEKHASFSAKDADAVLKRARKIRASDDVSTCSRENIRIDFLDGSSRKNASVCLGKGAPSASEALQLANGLALIVH